MSRYDSQTREAINRNTVTSLAMEQGFNVFLPIYDGGIDFILYRESDSELRKVQLKSRWTIDQKYRGRDIWMAFPMENEWYLVPHDRLVASAVVKGTTKTKSWTQDGAYSSAKPSKAEIAKWAEYRLASISKVVADAAEEMAE